MPLELSRANSKESPMSGWTGLDVLAPEPGGSWGFRNVDPPELATRQIGFSPFVGFSQYSYYAHLRAPRDFVGRGSVTVVWTPSGEWGLKDEEVATVYFGDGPKTVTPEELARIKKDVPVVFWPKIDGKRYDARIIYLNVPYFKVLEINEHFPPIDAEQNRSCILSPDQFEDEFGLKGWPKDTVRELAVKKRWNER